MPEASFDGESVDLVSVGEWVDLELASGWEPGPVAPKCRTNATGVEFTGSAYAPSGATFKAGTIAKIPAGHGLLVAGEASERCPASAALHGVAPRLVTSITVGYGESNSDIVATEDISEEGAVFFGSLRYNLT